jgi:hypothetical protein
MTTRPIRHLLTIAVLSVMLVGTAALPAYADERVCRGTIGAGTVDDVKVPKNATCTLNGTKVEGNVKVEAGAILEIFQQGFIAAGIDWQCAAHGIQFGQGDR